MLRTKTLDLQTTTGWFLALCAKDSGFRVSGLGFRGFGFRGFGFRVLVFGVLGFWSLRV